MADVRNLTRERLRADGVACRVVIPPQDATEPISVEWTLFDRDGVERIASEDGVQWAAAGANLPALGDAALLLIDDQGTPWALVWATGAPA